ncbi:MAG TPA: dihydrolipoamide acetyltransferase family protein [Gammaproteobacteria bacterium]|jgi:pyruvate dehydrogenase E2 component (dihydrolipoamide acetyltransferase)|nr:2-oxo acid dehydrogenase subunit E2 [Xanthomonadales bacterium]HPQ88333.1 dihydrolipoamide acetyltransferase family protein [Gammaproteobacteria bacterium]
MKIFNLPDLGEGLPDAEIVEWHVKEGDVVKEDQPMVSMETAKAVVDVPCPFSGRITKLHGNPGDVIDTGAPLVEFDGESSDSESVVTQAATASVKEEASKLKEEINELIDELDSDDTFPKSKAEVSSGNDSGTVVGEMESSDEVVSDISTVGNVKIAPAVKALAKKLKVDLNDVVATGAGGVIRPSDIRLAHEQGSTAAKPTPAPVSVPKMSEPKTVTPAPARPQPPAPIQKVEVTGEWEQVKGTRRTMARIMADSHAQIVPTTIMDDADIYKWLPGEDITARLIRAIVAGVEAEPALNSWFDGEKLARRLISHVDIGIAVDTPDGLFVPTMRNCEKRDAAQVRQGMNTIKEQVKSRSIPPQDMKDFTIMLSNFGVFAGRYATPVITPPCVAIIAAGKLLQEVVPVLGGFEVHRMIPLSLTFDHRAVTGGEAARFLAAVIKDLNKSK